MVFCDTVGRVYTLEAYMLPSARGQGEPLTGKVNPPPGAVFTSMLLGEDEDWYVFASDAGYGFLIQLKDLYSKNRIEMVKLF